MVYKINISNFLLHTFLPLRFFFIENLEVPSVTITSSASGTATTSTTPAGSATSASTLQPSNHRRKKPKRRSTGVVNLDVDVSSKKVLNLEKFEKYFYQKRRTL